MARVFAASQHPLIRAVLNRLIPAGAGFPGAGDLDLLDHLDRAACASAATQRAFVEGLRQIAIEGERRHGRAFEDLAAAEQDAALQYVEREHPAFFEALVSHVYQGYYSQPVVIALLGLEARPPQPQGHALSPFDVARTRATGQRGTLYRQA